MRKVVILSQSHSHAFFRAGRYRNEVAKLLRIRVDQRKLRQGWELATTVGI